MVTSWGDIRDAYVNENPLAEMADKGPIKIKGIGE
jgi:hypothetical protein